MPAPEVRFEIHAGDWFGWFIWTLIVLLMLAAIFSIIRSALARSNGKKGDTVNVAAVLSHPPNSATNIRPLFAAIGSDAILRVDEAMLRAVEAATGMGFELLEDATFDTLKERLDRARGYGRGFDKLHLAVHSTPDAIMLSDGPIDAIKLSRILRGVRVMLIAGCNSARLGDLLGVVPFTITMEEEVLSMDAARFSRWFWQSIGEGREPGEAVKIALDRAPSGMSEYVTKHF